MYVVIWVIPAESGQLRRRRRNRLKTEPMM